MKVLIILGSDSDADVGREVVKVLDGFSVEYKICVASAHRSPDRVEKLIAEAEEKGAKVIIAGAGLSAHLAGVVASKTLLPVIGIPMGGGPLNGMDSLLSTVNMPGGVPVATVSVGKAGGKNAAYLAVRILALSDTVLVKMLVEHKESMAKAVETADDALQEKLKD